MKKKLIIVSCLVMCLVFGTVPVFASDLTHESFVYDAKEYTISYGDIVFPLDSETMSKIDLGYHHTVIFNDFSDEYCDFWVITYSNDYSIGRYYAGNHFFYLLNNDYSFATDNTNAYLTKIRYDVNSKSFSKVSMKKYTFKDSSSAGDTYNFCPWGTNVEKTTIMYSSKDIFKVKYSSSNGYYCDGTLFFQKTSLLTLPPVAEKMDLSLTMAELIGVLPLVIGLVVCCLGLRKGWNLLAAALHKA